MRRQPAAMLNVLASATTGATKAATTVFGGKTISMTVLSQLCFTYVLRCEGS